MHLLFKIALIKDLFINIKIFTEDIYSNKESTENPLDLGHLINSVFIPCYLHAKSYILVPLVIICCQRGIVQNLLAKERPISNSELIKTTDENDGYLNSPCK